MNDQSLKSQLLALTIISLAPIAVMVLFSAVVFVLILTEEVTTDDQLILPFQYGVPAAMVVCLALGHFYFRSGLRNIPPDVTLREKMQRYQKISLIRVALMELPGIFGAMASLLTGYLPFLAAPLLIAVLFLLLRPNAFALATDLALTGDEKGRLGV